ncbi:MAG TPA: FHA domain-containing protein [Tepidisphaeraceae bacterium]|nr:FHA domain-containing protein [Tepidisphaeraceae bacterium]
MPTLPRELARDLPIFKVWGDDGNHPPVALDRPVCVIGRREGGVNLPLQAPQVSKLHALLVRTQQRVYVRDLASRNGVQRNGAPVQEVGLSNEDVLRVGSYTLRCASGFGDRDAPADVDTGAPAATADAPLPPAELVGPAGARYPFPARQHTLLIGQREGCDVRLEGDDDVAPVHAILFEMDTKRFVRDLGAPSGTFLNDQAIHQSELKPGDALRVGNLVLTYALVNAATDERKGKDKEDAEDTAAKLDPLSVDDSAPGIDLVASVANSTNIATADSMIVPEITMEDSRTPGSPPRQESPISEYDMDVTDEDPRRESTFAGEVIATVDGTSTTTTDQAKPARPEFPLNKPGSLQRGLDDSAIPIAGLFQDNILDEHPDAQQGFPSQEPHWDSKS